MTAAAHTGTDPSSGGTLAGAWLGPSIRLVAGASFALAVPFLINNYLIFWRGWPGVLPLFDHLLAAEPVLRGADVWQAWLQSAIYVMSFAYVALRVWRSPGRALHVDAERLSAISLYTVRAGFWAVLLIGVADVAISVLRVEGFLNGLIGADLTTALGRATFRGTYIHYPLIGVAMVIAYFSRSLGFIWLAFLIVMAEFMIVVFRFVFSYEQAFMGDVVRFWYAALFLFASAYTLKEGAHVRVDILYTRFTARGKAWTNAIGSAFLGIPLCWVILTRGMAGKANLINAPLLSFEVTQSGYGMFVKYLMAGFLVVYAVSMLAQFASYVLSSAGVLLGEPSTDENHPATT